MKKTTSFHLEEDVLNEIEKYKTEHNLSSRNVALERMLLERRSLINLQELIIRNQAAPIKQEILNNNIKKDKLDNSISDAFEDMPE